MSWTSDEILLQVRDLRVTFPSSAGCANVVRGTGFDVSRGEILAIVGESGSGKSMTARSIMRLVAPPGQIEAAELRFDGVDILSLTDDELRRLRGGKIGMIFQDPMTTLNPVLTVGQQLVQVLRSHKRMTRTQALAESADLLRTVGIHSPREQLDRYPHQMSGGMRQRVVIAMAVSCSPRLLIADEPTTALDVTIQAQILDLILDMRERMGMSVILITHDLGVVARVADRVAVMYAGRIVESGDTSAIFEDPQHPYTQALLRAVPRMTTQSTKFNSLEGSPPESTARIQGCSFSPRCSHSLDKCVESGPPLVTGKPNHAVACFAASSHTESRASR